MTNANEPQCKNKFNKASDKVVNWDEYQKKKRALEDEQFSWKEQLYQAFIDAPSRMVLWVGLALSEAKDLVLRKPPAANAGHSYYDSTQSPLHGDLYFDRDKHEYEISHMQKYGLGKTFQEKSAAIARQAFEESLDFSTMVKTGQFKKFDI